MISFTISRKEQKWVQCLIVWWTTWWTRWGVCCSDYYLMKSSDNSNSWWRPNLETRDEISNHQTFFFAANQQENFTAYELIQPMTINCQSPMLHLRINLNLGKAWEGNTMVILYNILSCSSIKGSLVEGVWVRDDRYHSLPERRLGFVSVNMGGVQSLWSHRTSQDYPPPARRDPWVPSHVTDM